LLSEENDRSTNSFFYFVFKYNYHVDEDNIVSQEQRQYKSPKSKWLIELLLWKVEECFALSTLQIRSVLFWPLEDREKENELTSTKTSANARIPTIIKFRFISIWIRL